MTRFITALAAAGLATLTGACTIPAELPAAPEDLAEDAGGAEAGVEGSPEGDAAAPDGADPLDAARGDVDGPGSPDDTAEAPPDTAPGGPEDVSAPADDANAGPDDANAPPDDDAASGTDDDATTLDGTPQADDASVPDTSVTPSGPCAQPIAFVEPVRFLEPLQFTVLKVTGGSGDHSFALVSGGHTGARVHALLGTFLAGPESGEVAVRVLDRRCGTSADMVAHVTPTLTVMPEIATIEPGRGRIRHAVSGGSGQWRVSVSAVAAGATAAARVEADGTIIAGDVEETLRVVVEDLATGRIREARLTVVAGGGLRVDPAALALPVGEGWPVSGRGGSGIIAVTAPGPAPGTEAVIGVAGANLTALAPGRVDLVVEDVHTGERVHLPVEVIAAPVVALHPAGDLKEGGAALTTDIDGDGHREVVVGVTESDLGAWDGGAIFIYRGTETGPSPEPGTVIASESRTEELGTSLAAGDVNGDGYADLVAGAPLADGPGLDRGRVSLWYGQADGGVSPKPDWSWFGETNSDQLGLAVGLCDVNGDERLDLLVTARFAEDEERTPVVANTGGLFVFLGYTTGFRSEPDQVIWGAVPEEGVMRPRAIGLGRALATGHVDGDGRCDVAISGLSYSAGDGRSNDGIVYVYRGRGPDSFGPGGLASTPSLVVRGDEVDSGAQLGVSLALGDLDGDLRDELAMGEPEYGLTPPEGARRASNGAVLLVGGATIPETGLLDLSARSLGWRYVGRPDEVESSDRYGVSLAIADWDGEGPDDLFIGTRADEQLVPPAATRVADTGTVHVLRGRDGTLPSLAYPAAVYTGDTNGQLFGLIFAVQPDLDGDGLAELVGRASQDSRLGPRVGLTWLRTSAPQAPLVTLETPLGSAGSRLGAALAVLDDLDGDGYPELAVGAPRAQLEPGPLPVPPTRPGLVSLHRTGPHGVSDTPFLTLGGFTGHTQLDGFGEALAAVRDFNGDGRPDLAVAARLEDGPTACARTDAGAVYLFGGTVAGGIAPTPMGFFLAPQSSGQAQELASGDFNGDGVSDVALGGQLWDLPDTSTSNNAGGVGLVYGTARMAAAGPLVTRCQPDVTLLGFAASDLLGLALAAIPDLNGDGCDELAIGAPLGDLPGLANSGFVHVLWGFGPRCAFQDARRTTLTPRHASAQVGSSLAAADADGDGRADLAVGGPFWSNGIDTTGAAWLVDGAWLASLDGSALPWTPGVAIAASDVMPFAPPGGATREVSGRRRDEASGFAVALMSGVPGASTGGLVAAAPASPEPGVPGAGTVRLHALSGAGPLAAISAEAALAVGGESSRPGAEFGAALVAWRAGGQRWIAIGAPVSSALGTDEGAFFVVRAP